MLVYVQVGVGMCVCTGGGGYVCVCTGGGGYVCVYRWGQVVCVYVCS